MLRSGRYLMLNAVLENAAVAKSEFEQLERPAPPTSGAGYWLTASTFFENPAAVMGRMWSDSFAGIAPQSAFAFVLAQFGGGAVGAWVASMLGSGSYLGQVAPGLRGVQLLSCRLLATQWLHDPKKKGLLHFL